jgi:DnaJ-class molecular chaperone
LELFSQRLKKFYLAGTQCFFSCDDFICSVLNSAGMKDGEQIRFSGEADQEPGIQPGDIIVVLDEQSHPVFKRSGHDLFYNMEIDLVDSLCGFQKTIPTLDGRALLVTSLPGTCSSTAVSFAYFPSSFLF